METTKRSPLEIVHEGNGEKCHPAVIRAHHLVITVSRAEDFEDPLPDAKFIVKACNLHDSMVYFLKEMKESGGTLTPLGWEQLNNLLSVAGQE